MRTKRSFAVRPKRPTAWQGGWLTPGQAFQTDTTATSAALYRAQLTFPFNGVATAGRPTMLDAVLQRFILDLNILCYMGAAGTGVNIAYGVSVCTVDDTGVLAVTDPVPNPLLNTEDSFILQGFMPGGGGLITNILHSWGANLGGVGTRIESKAKRRLRDNDILVLSLTGTSSGANLGFQVNAGWRALFKGR